MQAQLEVEITAGSKSSSLHLFARSFTRKVSSFLEHFVLINLLSNLVDIEDFELINIHRW